METLLFVSVVLIIAAFFIGRSSISKKLEEEQEKNRMLFEEKVGLKHTHSKALAEEREMFRRSLEKEREENRRSFEKEREENSTLLQELVDLKQLFEDTFQKIHSESALLPSLARWAEAVQKAYDKGVSHWLEHKPDPAIKAAEEVKIARREARERKRELDLVLNRIDLYESLAPLLTDYTELTVAELLEGLREEQSEFVDEEVDPVSRYITKLEWSELTLSERNQTALDRYLDPTRKITPWHAGIQYERYVGYVFEKNQYKVTYQGATKGNSDLGIDLVCENDENILIVQCKRLSRNKGLPVRENVIAHIYGSAEFYKMLNKAKKPVLPCLVTTFELSQDARMFAKHLNVIVNENFEMKPYPTIKCTISHLNNEKIYHLPMDQQYDNVVVGDKPGEFYALTVKEAEDAGFRRSFRWQGTNPSA